MMSGLQIIKVIKATSTFCLFCLLLRFSYRQFKQRIGAMLTELYCNNVLQPINFSPGKKSDSSVCYSDDELTRLFTR